ncbi:TetR/AcrR family transcriptional regulator [Mycobacterium sp. SMC-4]|uniref:TetR/AcrR family transcriptional regulator n=1 Tax=Mycobacterium sp. SMC-4 TaxID=2857059 RepID=UPI003D009947
MSDSRRGRPRSRVVHQSILEATRELLTEDGYTAITIDRVAERAGVGKQTVYRRWSSKSPLVAEAVSEVFGRGTAMLLPDTGDVAADLRTFMQDLAKFIATPRNVAVLRALAAAAADSPQDGASLYRELTAPQHDAVVQRLREGVRCGQLSNDIDTESVADALVGAFLYRILSRPADADTSYDVFDGLVHAMLAGIEAKPESG